MHPSPPSSFSCCILPSFFPFVSHNIFLPFYPSLLSSIPSPNAASKLHPTHHPPTAAFHSNKTGVNCVHPFQFPTLFFPILLLHPTIPSSHFMLPFHSPTTVFSYPPTTSHHSISPPHASFPFCHYRFSPILLLHPTIPSSPLATTAASP